MVDDWEHYILSSLPMRNTIVVLMGQMLEPSALRLKQYILQHGEPSVADYLQVVAWRPADDGTSSSTAISHVSHCVHTDTVPGEFCSDLSNAYQVAFDQPQDLHSENEIGTWWSHLFAHTVTLQHQGDTTSLHVSVVVPLWESAAVNEAITMARVISRLSHSVVIDVLALPPTISSLFDPELSVTASSIEQRRIDSRKSFDELQQARKEFASLHGLVMIEGCNTQGVALDMDYDTWLRILGEYSLLACENYLSLFPVNLQTSDSDVTTFGISILHFDRFYFIHYLLRRAYLKILGREQVSTSEVDINKVARIAQEQLLKHHQVFSRIYTQDVEPMIRQGLDDNSILARITDKVKAETDQMVDDFQSFIDREDLSLPEKQATLAQLLGLNDELYAGNLFSRDQLMFEDCASDVIDVFVQENNLLDDNSVLTTPIDPETNKVHSPIKELKQSRLIITESDRYIRLKRNEMELWQQQITESIDCEKRLTSEGFVYGAVTYRFMDNQDEVKLFEENYQPRPVTVESIDMRPLFSPVRDQGQLGACTVFAMTGVYEFLLKKLGKPQSDLSEHFVYYNVSTIENGVVVDDGSSIYDVAQSMSQKGICLEHLCRYNGTLERPSEDAYAEAQNHLLKQVKNVVVTSDTKANHNAITSALAEGYPVIISLKLFESFGSGMRGFVPRPSADEKRMGTHGNHCMVICGFSNEEKVYIVRNSWGRNFGDSGYCYIPYSYIDDAAFLNQACIITQIAESDNLGGFTHVSIPKVSFSTTDANIRYAIAANQIGEEQVHLETEQRRYDVLAEAYFRLSSDLENNGVRRRILDGAEQRLTTAIAEREEAKRQFINVTYPQQLRELKQSQRAGWIVLGSIAAAWAIVLTVFLSYDAMRSLTSDDFWTTLIIVGALIVVGFIAYHFVCRSNYNALERELDHHRDKLAQEVEALRRELSAKHLKLHIAGMFIEKINRVQHQLDHKYKLLRGYVGNLVQWMADEQATLDQMQVREHNPFIPVLQNEALDRFFDEHQDQITESIRLYRLLDSVGLSDDDVLRYKTQVRDDVARLLVNQMADFNMADYVLNVVRYPYLSSHPNDVALLLSRLHRQSDCFLQLHSDGRIDEDCLSCYVMLRTADQSRRQQWQSLYPRYFQQQPSDVSTFVSPLKLIELQVRHISPSQVVWLVS